MSLWEGLFKSKEHRRTEQAERARQMWWRALQSGDQIELESAASDLAMARLAEEYSKALYALMMRFPEQRCRYHNDLGIHYYSEGLLSKALEHYVESYHLDDGSGCAEANILELCRDAARDCEDPRDAVAWLLRFFRICTKGVDPKAVFDETSLTTLLGSRKPVSLAEERLAQAEGTFDELEELLAYVKDPAFVAQTEEEMEQISRYFGIQRL